MYESYLPNEIGIGIKKNSKQKPTCRILCQPTGAVFPRCKYNLMRFSERKGKGIMHISLEFYLHIFWAETQKIAEIVTDRWGISSQYRTNS
jgi:hypothetical protein